MRYDQDPFGFQPDAYDPEYPELGEDPHWAKYILILGLMGACLWAGVAKAVGWI